jgi:hypothetical protein
MADIFGAKHIGGQVGNRTKRDGNQENQDKTRGCLT